MQVRAKIPEIHAVIDRAISSSGLTNEARCPSPSRLGSSRSVVASGSRRGSTLKMQRRSTLTTTTLAAATTSAVATPRAVEVAADLCLGSKAEADQSSIT